jgi:Polyketide cyclase / dehydrase and lipid transport
VSRARQQAFIDAPVERIWELVSDIERHPQWWPRVAETEIEQIAEKLAAGDTYRQVTRRPLGTDETRLEIESLDEFRGLSIRCLKTGMFVRFGLTEAQDGTFVDGEMGMDPRGFGNRVFDALAGRRYFSKWMAETFTGLERAACEAPPRERREAS